MVTACADQWEKVQKISWPLRRDTDLRRPTNRVAHRFLRAHFGNFTSTSNKVAREHSSLRSTASRHVSLTRGLPDRRTSEPLTAFPQPRQLVGLEAVRLLQGDVPGSATANASQRSRWRRQAMLGDIDAVDLDRWDVEKDRSKDLSPSTPSGAQPTVLRQSIEWIRRI
jgi:hypothetical protein